MRADLALVGWAASKTSAILYLPAMQSFGGQICTTSILQAGSFRRVSCTMQLLLSWMFKKLHDQPAVADVQSRRRTLPASRTQWSQCFHVSMGRSTGAG